MNDQSPSESNTTPATDVTCDSRRNADLELSRACPRFVELLIEAEGNRATPVWTPNQTVAWHPTPSVPAPALRASWAMSILRRATAGVAACVLITAGLIAASRFSNLQPSANVARSHKSPEMLAVDDAATGDASSDLSNPASARAVDSLSPSATGSETPSALAWNDNTERQLQAAFQTLMYVNSGEAEPDDQRLQAAATALQQLQADMKNTGL